MHFRFRETMGLHKLARAMLVSALLAGAASASEISDVTALVQSRQFSVALPQADAFLARQPNDPQMRFLKGLILTGLERRAEAIAVFTKLSSDYPQQPGPYNNLAVLYAANGQYDNARAVLEKAVRLNPGYARAQENLGDIYTKLANQSYSAMLQLEPDNVDVRVKQSLLRTAIDYSTDRLPVSNSGNTAGAMPEKNVPPPVVLPSTPVSQFVKAPSSSGPPIPGPDLNVNAESGIVVAAVNEWAAAWAARDMNRYLGFYSSHFRTPYGESRSRWEAKRRSRIQEKSSISIKILSPQVSIEGTKAKVQFLQIYTSNRNTSNERKTLLMEKEGERWKIVQEQSGK